MTLDGDGNTALATGKIDGCRSGRSVVATTLERWKLYWVETPDRMEDCFVVAKNRRQAAAYEAVGSGFDTGSCIAEFISDIPDAFLEIAKRIRTAQENRRSIPGLITAGPGY